MNQFVLEDIEIQLKKRHQYKYVWYKKQNNQWDGYTNFIYDTLLWENLIPKMATAVKNYDLNKEELFYYASNRWYNFWSSIAIEQIFTEINGVDAVNNNKDKEKDFYLFGNAFDHKTSNFPKHLKNDITYAKSNKRELIDWFYKNQSTQKRHHFKNRLFVVVHDKNGEHWKIKAEIGLLKAEIEKYVSNFTQSQLQSFTFAKNTETLSDIIWVTR
jgi:hypothetical protein